METAVRPARGGYLRPFGTAIFIKDYLMGLGPDYGVEVIDPGRGAPITDIHRSYKRALHSDMAEDMAARDAEKAARRGKPMTPEEIERRWDYYLGRIPSKLTRMRYSSFTRYFRFFMQLGWVEKTGEVEGSLIGGPEDTRPPQATPRGTVLVEVPQPRIYYRLTPKGKEATIVELSDPIMTIYNYPREQRRELLLLTQKLVFSYFKPWDLTKRHNVNLNFFQVRPKTAHFRTSTVVKFSIAGEVDLL